MSQLSQGIKSALIIAATAPTPIGPAMLIIEVGKNLATAVAGDEGEEANNFVDTAMDVGRAIK